MKIYDSRTQTKREFKPIDLNNIGIYVCGITVYDYCHIGHARTAIAFDIIVRYLKLKYGAHNVKFVRNITDIDDKIIKRAQENNETTEQLTDRFIEAMHEDFAALDLLAPDVEPKATEYMPQMIAMVEKLIDKDHAYAVENGDVFYKVRSFKDYGSLSKRDIEKLRCGERVDVNTQKQDPLDFVLWKRAKEGEPAWESPWGSGRPGWHLECSAMSTDILGETFDLHGGGFDLLFPHHENECAQSCATHDSEFVKTWMHVGFLQINKEKMAKSAGNFITIRDIFAHAKPEELRYLILTGHYRSQIEYSPEQIDQARNNLVRLYTALNGIEIIDDTDLPRNNEYAMRFMEAMDDDFNSPEALAILHELSKELNNSKDPRLAALFKYLGSILGILQAEPAEFLGIIENADAHVSKLIDERNKARAEKNWAKADKIRDELTKLGVKLEDMAKGQTQAKKL